ncbi:diguanylate cyclase [Thiomicrospira sp. R3]|uniref:sensor domain-containing diguanylate cyclase n=1 Tax=Thiomicrospira sp. R3 TaxID=3035472 RepID=UPI00259BD100|nr:sensor domain-containing diguanylate cyclase [Thiomicrospira sp. R3]WFE68237.1 diguanylate cyclase [Thiomicrospira sp. R3]
MAHTDQTLNSQLEAIANAMPDPIFIMGQDGTYLDIIGGNERSLYADGHALMGKTYQQVLPEKMAMRFLNVVHKAIKTQRLQEIEYQLANDQVQGIEPIGPQGGQWYEARVYPLDTDAYGQPAVIWLAINITSRKHMEEQIEHLSKNDALTGFYNRDFFLGLSDEFINQAKLNNNPISLIKIDLDCFKNITDGYGHELGDKAMLGAAHAIQATLGELGHIGRLSCDQFMVILPDVKAVDAFRIAKLAQEKIAGHKIRLDNKQMTCLTSQAGVTELRAADEDSRILFNRVNEAIAQLRGSREITKIL